MEVQKGTQGRGEASLTGWFREPDTVPCTHMGPRNSLSSEPKTCFAIAEKLSISEFGE